MQLIIAAAVILIALILIRYVRVRLIVRRRSTDLAAATGLPAEQIRQQLIRDRLTPGEWALQHGLDPILFRPTPGSSQVLRSWIESTTREPIIAISHGPLSTANGLVAVAVTAEAVYVQSSIAPDRTRIPYSHVAEAHVNEPGTFGSNFFLGDVGGGSVLADLDRPEAVANAINKQIRKITTFTKRVQLTANGGAIFRWRPMGDDFAWSVEYDAALRSGLDGPSEEVRLATQRAIEDLNREREDQLLSAPPPPSAATVPPPDPDTASRRATPGSLADRKRERTKSLVRSLVLPDATGADARRRREVYGWSVADFARLAGETVEKVEQFEDGAALARFHRVNILRAIGPAEPLDRTVEHAPSGVLLLSRVALDKIILLRGSEDEDVIDQLTKLVVGIGKTAGISESEITSRLDQRMRLGTEKEAVSRIACVVDEIELIVHAANGSVPDHLSTRMEGIRVGWWLTDRNKLALTLVVDTNIIGDAAAAVLKLKAHQDAGFITLLVTDTVTLELSAADPDTRSILFHELSDLAVATDFGVRMDGHSLVDAQVAGSTQDADRFHRLWEIVRPNVRLDGAGPQHVRDVKHLDTVIRYARGIFVTRDTAVLNKRQALKDEFGIDVLTPEDALARVDELRSRYEISQQPRSEGRYR